MSKLQDIIHRAVIGWFPNREIITDFRPVWLRGLEIDIFVPSLRLAIEVQGSQHRLFCPRLQASISEFNAQRRRDKLKRRILHDNGVCLLSVKQSRRYVLGGLQTKVSRFLHRPVRTPVALKKEWDAHIRFLSKNCNIAFKVHNDGNITPVNQASSSWLKSQSKSPIKSKLFEAAHLTPAYSRECVETRILPASGVVPINADLHPGGAVTVIYPVRA